MICPKCGFEQPDGSTDCARCGVVFARYRATPAAGTLLPIEPLPPISPGSSASPPPEEPLYGGPLPPPPPPQLYGDPLPSSFGRPGLHIGRTFDIGSILGETFQTYFSNFLSFTLLTALAFAPLLGYQILMTSQKVTSRTIPWIAVAAFLLQLLCWPLATATVTFGVFQQMRGRETSISDCLKVGLSNLLPVLGVAILEGCAILAGACLCGFPAFIALATLAVSVPVAIEESPGLFAALNRSGELTRNFRWRIFCILFLLLVISFVAALVFGTLSLSFSSIPVVAFLLRTAPGIVTSGLSATAAAVMYYRLRSVKESVDIENIASVFD